MYKAHLNQQVLTDISWWHWLLTIPLLGINLAGYRWGMAGAMGLCSLAGGYFWYRLRDIKPYPVQVRIAYVTWSAVGLLPGMQWMLWIQLCGTTAMVTVGYCPLIRLLSLLPLNRTEPLTTSLVWRAFVQEPCAGGLVEWTTDDSSHEGNCCSLPTNQISLACSLPVCSQSTSQEFHRA